MARPDPFRHPIARLPDEGRIIDRGKREEIALLEPVKKLKLDTAKAAASLGRLEARWSVDTYYTIQRYRVASNNRLKAFQRSGSDEPHAFHQWTLDQLELLEKQMTKGLFRFIEAQPIHAWLERVHGIGPVLAAGLVAHLELRPTVGAWWRFAGLDPTQVWEKGKKRPWNSELKTLCWKIGDSFVKVSNRPDAYYGKAYRKRKEYEIARNKPEIMREVAEATLAAKKYGRDTKAKRAYEQGILPDGRIDLRARRWTVKLFLSHLHEVWWRLENGTQVPKPWVIEHDGHAHYLAPPYTEGLF